MPPKPSKVLCACNCGKKVSHRTQRLHLEGRAKLSVAVQFARQNLEPESQLQAATTKRLRTRSHGTEKASKRRQVQDQPTTEDFQPTEILPFTEGVQDLELEGSSNELGNEQAALLLPDASLPARRSRRIAKQTEAIIERRWGNDPQPGDESEYDYELPNEDYTIQTSSDSEGEEEEEYEEDVAEAPVDENGISPWDRLGESFQRETAALDNKLSEEDVNLILKYTLKVEDHLTERTFRRLERTYPNEHHDSLKATKKRVQFLSGFKPIRYSCCVNSCVCYTGYYEHHTKCPNPECGEDRYKANGKPRKYFNYHPLTPRLIALYRNPEYAEKMRYRANYEHIPGETQDVFDGTHYQTLLKKIVPNNDENNPSFYFSDPRDIAIGISTDGFAPFKRRRQTCWPIIAILYNLAPELRFLKPHRLDLGTIPGPKKPWDADSFLWPIVEEFSKLATGVKAWDASTMSYFILRAYLILLFGDIPAIALLMRMKGPNGISPCRTCKINGIREPGSKTHYVPLRRDTCTGADPPHYDSSELPIRTHDEFIEQADAVQLAPSGVTHKALAKKYGINGRCILASIPSVSFPESFPFDFMHLLWENLVPNLISFWIGEFKDLDHENADYVIAPHIWTKVGIETAACGATIPSAFGARVPNIATHRSLMTSEMYSNWTLFIAPIVLRGRFKKRRYYKHFMQLVELLKLCLELEISDQMLDKIDKGFKSWVETYERLYYKHDSRRLSACPLTIHALLHISWYIRVLGPVWAYWAFPMERHCNFLLQSIRSRRHPYESISNFTIAVAQLNLIRLLYNMFDKMHLDPKRSETSKVIYDGYPFALSAPRQEILEPLISSRIQSSLSTWLEVPKRIVAAIVKFDKPILQYGRVTRLDDGDTMIAREIVHESEDTRDASYVKYIQDVDRFASQRNRTPEFISTTFFGQLKRILVIELPASPQLGLESPKTMICTMIHNVKAELEGQLYYYEDLGRLEIVDLNSVKCVVGRVCTENRWGIIDRSNTTVCQTD